jgi:hypothetical protein
MAKLVVALQTPSHLELIYSQAMISVEMTSRPVNVSRVITSSAQIVVAVSTPSVVTLTRMDTLEVPSTSIMPVEKSFTILRLT